MSDLTEELHDGRDTVVVAREFARRREMIVRIRREGFHQRFGVPGLKGFKSTPHYVEIACLFRRRSTHVGFLLVFSLLRPFCRRCANRIARTRSDTTSSLERGRWAIDDVHSVIEPNPSPLRGPDAISCPFMGIEFPSGAPPLADRFGLRPIVPKPISPRGLLG